MDELAHELGIDPLELRRVNEAEKDPSTGRPFSSRHEAGRSLADWDQYDVRPRLNR